MSAFQPFSLKARNFKCFGKEEQGFEQIKSVNIILGRNNSGKSTLLDFLEELSRLEKIRKEQVSNAKTQPWSIFNVPAEYWHGKSESEFIVGINLTESSLRENFSEQTRLDQEIVNSLFSEAQRRNPYSSVTHWDIGQFYINSRITLKLKLTPGARSFERAEFKKTILSIKPVNTPGESGEKDYLEEMSRVIESKPLPFNNSPRFGPQPNYHLVETECKKLNAALSKSAENIWINV